MHTTLHKSLFMMASLLAAAFAAPMAAADSLGMGESESAFQAKWVDGISEGSIIPPSIDYTIGDGCTGSVTIQVTIWTDANANCGGDCMGNIAIQVTMKSATQNCGGDCVGNIQIAVALEDQHQCNQFSSVSSARSSPAGSRAYLVTLFELDDQDAMCWYYSPSPDPTIVDDLLGMGLEVLCANYRTAWVFIWEYPPGVYQAYCFVKSFMGEDCPIFEGGSNDLLLRSREDLVDVDTEGNGVKVTIGDGCTSGVVIQANLGDAVHSCSGDCRGTVIVQISGGKPTVSCGGDCTANIFVSISVQNAERCVRETAGGAPGADMLKLTRARSDGPVSFEKDPHGYTIIIGDGCRGGLVFQVNTQDAVHSCSGGCTGTIVVQVSGWDSIMECGDKCVGNIQVGVAGGDQIQCAQSTVGSFATMRSKPANTSEDCNATVAHEYGCWVSHQINCWDLDPWKCNRGECPPRTPRDSFWCSVYWDVVGDVVTTSGIDATTR